MYQCLQHEMVKILFQTGIYIVFLVAGNATYEGGNGNACLQKGRFRSGKGVLYHVH
jgi:hypothetical protein